MGSHDVSIHQRMPLCEDRRQLKCEGKVRSNCQSAEGVRRARPRITGAAPNIFTSTRRSDVVKRDTGWAQTVAAREFSFRRDGVRDGVGAVYQYGKAKE